MAKRNLKSTFNFNTGLTRILKKGYKKLFTRAILCNVLNADGTYYDGLYSEYSGDIYITNGIILAKMTQEEYEAFIRPISLRDPGNWRLEYSGEITPYNETRSKTLKEIMDGFASPVKPEYTFFETPLSLYSEKEKVPFTAFYSEEMNEVRLIDTRYIDAIIQYPKRGSQLHIVGKAERFDPLLFVNEMDDVKAVIIPKKCTTEEARAVRAFYDKDAPKNVSDAGLKNALSKKDEEIESLTAQLNTLKESAQNRADMDAKSEINSLTSEILECRSEIADLKEELGKKEDEIIQLVDSAKADRNLENEILDLEQTLFDCNNHMKDVEQENQDLHEKFDAMEAKLNARIDTLYAENQDLQETLSQKDKEIETLTAQLNSSAGASPAADESEPETSNSNQDKSEITTSTAQAETTKSDSAQPSDLSAATFHIIVGGNEAYKVSGYTDDRFNYFEYGGQWNIIPAKYGVKIASEGTLDCAKEKAQTFIDGMREIEERNAPIWERYAQLICDAQALDAQASESATDAEMSVNEAEMPTDKGETSTSKESPAAKKGVTLPGKYARLYEDLKAALASGVAAEKENPEDGGTCNFDSVMLYLPRWKRDKIAWAAKLAGTRATKFNSMGSGYFLFHPDTNSQGNARTRNAQAMCKALDSMGYPASMHHRAD